MSAQSIRPSQYVTTYGPGSIIEGRNGPRLIPTADIGLFCDRTIRIEDYEIYNSRMREGVLGGAKVFRLPSNAELSRDDSIPIYRTKIFPNWNLCVNTNKHDDSNKDNIYILYYSSLQECPVCKEPLLKNRQAVRFILACPGGHVDDFDWSFFIHADKKQCNNKSWFIWTGGGSSLSNIFIKCPDCGIKSKSLEYAYRETWPCHGRFPEREDFNGSSPPRKSCSYKARIIQRQASNLRIADIVSLLTIPPRDTALHRMLDDQLLKSHFLTGTFSSKGEIEVLLRKLEENGFIRQDKVNAILDHTWNEISQSINDLNKPSATNYLELIIEELNELLKASRDGAPPVYRQNQRSTNVLFEVDKNRVKQFTDVNNRTFIATPISKLSEIAVQVSYRREIRSQGSGGEAKAVDVSFIEANGEKWYPGMELHGEGIFISTVDGLLPKLNGKRAEEWYKAYSLQYNYDSTLFRYGNQKVEVHPLFVYLHTLSHSIIRSLSIDSGYSSSAIHERIYLDTKGKKPRGGVIIYATQPGSDGTSGGLISQVDSFQHIYDSAIDSLQSCSNDPLCIQDQFGADGTRVNGSSCYGCTLISETACTHRNLWLDRGLILENIP